MTYEVHLRHYSRIGAVKNSEIRPWTAVWIHSLYTAAPLRFTLNEDTVDALPEAITEYDIMEVMLRNTELGIQSATGGFTPDFVGIVRGTPGRVTDISGKVTNLSFFCPEQKHILSWRHVLYASGVADRSQYTSIPIETIMKSLVTFNLTSSAVGGAAPLRQRTGDLLPGMGLDIQVAADSGGGDVKSKSFQGGNVLRALREVALIGKDDFSLTWRRGTAIFDFEYHANQLGEDKTTGSDKVTFSLENQTMSLPRQRTAVARATVASANGQKEGILREFTVVEGEDFAANNDIEMFVDARLDGTTAAARTAKADLKLDEAQQFKDLQFNVNQTQGTFYSPIAVTGRQTYKLGDVGSAVYGDTTNRKVSRVELNWQDAGISDSLQIDVDTAEF